MDEQPKWIINEEQICIQKWTEYLSEKAKGLFAQDGTHANLLFCFSKDKGLVSIDPVPPNTSHEQLNIAIVNAVHEHNLYGVVFIGEIWMYPIKENDHTVFQLLDGEMNVSDLKEGDKKEALLVRMENRDGGCLIHLNEIGRHEKKTTLTECKTIHGSQKKWF